MADDKRTDDKKPVEDKKDDDKKKPEDMTPTPTQEEADEAKVKLFGGPDAKVEQREAEEAPEILPPTPTQWENDAAKIVAMGGDPPTDPGAPIDQAREKRAVEAEKPGGYTTRSRKPE